MHKYYIYFIVSVNQQNKYAYVTQNIHKSNSILYVTYYLRTAIRKKGTEVFLRNFSSSASQNSESCKLIYECRIVYYAKCKITL